MASRELLDDAPAQSARVASQSRGELDVLPPSGPAAAVIVAAGIACVALGLLSVLTAASASVSDALTVSERVGDVSGLSIVTGLVFFAAWGGLFMAWRRADPPLARVALWSAALVVLGLIGTFPPFFNVFS